MFYKVTNNVENKANVIKYSVKRNTQKRNKTNLYISKLIDLNEFENNLITLIKVL
jgi:hypothetical protein